MNQRLYTSQKNDIIEAAVKLILDKGPNALKTDAIIKASDLSKGGFFYHFKTIDDLLFELAKKSWVDFLDCVQNEAEKDPKATGRFCRAYVRVSLGMVKLKEQDNAINQVFLAVATTNRKLLDRLKKEGQELTLLFNSMVESDNLPEEKIKLIRMAADGFWFNEMLGLVEMKKKEKKEFCDYLISLTSKK